MNKPSSDSEDISLENPVLLKFHKDDFEVRLKEMITRTNGYNSTLSQTWEKVEQGAQSTRMVDLDPRIEKQAFHHILDLVKRIRNADIQNVVIEASHAYLYDSMDDADFLSSMETQYEHANKLAHLLRENRIAVKRVLFIDDYNPPPEMTELVKHLDVEAYLQFAKDHGFYPDFLIKEADMKELARELITYMHNEQGLVLRQVQNGNETEENNGNEDRQLLKHRNVELVKGSGFISCAALDAALSIIKFHYLASGIVNVLPKHQREEDFSFKGQQKKVRQILGEHFNVRVLPFFNIFTSDNVRTNHTSGSHSQFRKKNNAKRI